MCENEERADLIAQFEEALAQAKKVSSDMEAARATLRNLIKIAEERATLRNRAIFELHFAAAIRTILRAVTSGSTLTTKAARGVLRVWNSAQLTEWDKKYLRFLVEASPDRETLELKINEIIKMAEGKS